MKYGLIITIAALLLLGACRKTNTGNEAKTNTQQTEKKEARKQNIIRKRIATPFEFNHITNLGSVDIIYTQGNYNIEVEGDSTTLNYLITEFDSNVLTVNLELDNNTDINLYGNTNNVKMYISAPELKCVSICGNGGFESQDTWRAENIQLGVLSSGSMKIAKVECTTFDLQSTDIGEITLTDLQAEDAAIYSCSTATINANVNVKKLIVVNDGGQKLTLTGKAHNVKIKNPNDMNLTNKLTIGL